VIRGASLLALACLYAQAADRVTVGFGQAPPLHYSDAHRGAAGFIVDAINEAARREQIQVTWRQVAGSQDIEPALQEGRIDIFPSAIATQIRRTRFWISEPWWTEDLSILVRADFRDVGQINWHGEKVVLPSRAYLPMANVITPGAIFKILGQQQWRRGLEFGASLLCSGDADAVLMSHSTMDEALAKRPENCLQTDFKIVETASSLPLAVISRWDRNRLAERIRSRIDEMALDGTLITIAGRYPRTPARSAIVLAETLRQQYRQKLLWTAFVGMLLIAVLATALLTRQIQIQRKLRRTMAEQIEVERVLRTRTQELMLSNEELQAFAYSVSHDLQEPLRIIGLYAQVLERNFPLRSNDANDHLNIIRRNAVRMQEMLQQLLLLSRVSRSEVRRVTVPLQDVLSTVLQDFRVIIASTSAEIVIGPMPCVKGWPDRLSVVFQNLIGNALKYCKADVPPRIEICAVDQGTEWKLSVTDNGIGFEQKYAESIFGVFRRLHVQDQYGGTGVGLAIVKRVVERHGGRIWAEGKPGQGSTFYFTLPKEPDDEFANATIGERQGVSGMGTVV
jgi:signal transduction histidine kinase